MQGEVSRGTMIAAIVVVLLVIGGVGWWVMGRNSGATPPPGYKPGAPVGGSAGMASGPGAMMRGARPPAPGGSGR